MTFQLHPQLQQDCIEVGQFHLCQLLLSNDSQFPWFILVPRRIEITEIYQLAEQDQQSLQYESSILAKTLAHCYHADKMNIAAIGNLVPQLHIHHVVRYRTDIAWPAPIWGEYSAVPYAQEQQQEVVGQIRQAFKGSLID